MRNSLITLGIVMSAALLVLLALASFVSADTIVLTNGNIIYGKLVRPEQSNDYIKPGNVRVKFSNGGWFEFKATDIKSVEVNDLDAFKKTTN